LSRRTPALAGRKTEGFEVDGLEHESSSKDFSQFLVFAGITFGIVSGAFATRFFRQPAIRPIRIGAILFTKMVFAFFVSGCRRLF